MEAYYCYNRFNSTEIDHWCYSRYEEGGQFTCPELTEQEIQKYKNGLGACFKTAVDLGFDLTVNARVDDGRALGGWRNTLAFDPQKEYNGFSYETGILQPLVDVMLEAAGPSTQLAITPQGEMGATVFLYPESWIDVTTSLKAQLGSDSEVGLGINNLKLCGCIGVPIINAYEYLATLPTDFPKVADQFDNAAIRNLFTNVDYVALSAYIPQYNLTFPPCDMEALMVRLDEEFSYYNLTLKELSDEYGVPIRFQEFGVGGAKNPYGEAATTAEEAAEFPYFGINGQFSCDKDPFKGCESGTNPIKEYRRHYFRTTAEWLAQGGCNYTADKVYIWNLGSWDVLAISPTSFDGQGNYSDPEIVRIINEHNSEMGVERTAVQTQSRDKR